MASVAESMQEQLTAQKTVKRNKENLRRKVDVLKVATTLTRQKLFTQCNKEEMFYCSSLNK